MFLVVFAVDVVPRVAFVGFIVGEEGRRRYWLLNLIGGGPASLQALSERPRGVGGVAHLVESARKSAK